MAVISLNSLVSAIAAASLYCFCFNRILIFSICLSTVFLSGSCSTSSAALSVCPRSRYLLTSMPMAASRVSSSWLSAACWYHSMNLHAYVSRSSADRAEKERHPSRSRAREYRSRSQLGYSCNLPRAWAYPALKPSVTAICWTSLQKPAISSLDKSSWKVNNVFRSIFSSLANGDKSVISG